MKIPFDIKFRPQIESGEYKVETGTGFPAKVMDWEYNNKICGKSVAIKVIESDGDHSLFYTLEGNRASIFPLEEGCDLFIVTPEPELTEFEKKLSDVVGYAISFSVTEPQKLTSEFVKEYASELLALAREELFANDAVLKEYAEAAREQGKAEALLFANDAVLKEYAEAAREQDKAEALKDLPRWKKHEEASDKLAMVWNDFVTPWLDWRGHRIAVRDLEKLPGFNN